MAADFKGAQKALVQVTYKYGSDTVVEDVIFDRKEMEREGNQAHGAENILDPNWRTMTDKEFSQVVDRIVSSLFNGAFVAPLDPENRPAEFDELIDTTLFIPSGHIKSVVVRTVGETN